MGVATRPEADLGTPAGPRPTAQPPRPSPGPKALRRIPRRPRLPGAPRLRSFLRELRALVGDSTGLTLVCHSYGTVVCA
ncbi:alpha/beta hydrolase, partial [Streptomyces scabiei]|uniref:alpha/beta hydrolase n=1 Tax=Streptomyces scabiei TaxID=1930 RepID=UPI0029C04EFF